MAQNPPEQLRGVLERQIQDLDEQLGEGGTGEAPAGSTELVSLSSGDCLDKLGFAGETQRRARRRRKRS